MEYLKYLKYLNVIVQLIKMAEGAFSGKGTGEQKKEFVKTGIGVVSSAMEAESTGGQKETWEKINDNLVEPVNGLIDGVSEMLYPRNEGK